jgi:hypothetical protein
MPKEEKKRTFESDVLILPALKMVLVHTEKDENKLSTKKAKQKAARDLNEETVLRIIDKLIAKD